MSTEELKERLIASIEDSLAQLGRGSGITPEHRRRMAEIIAHPLVFIIEEAVDD